MHDVANDLLSNANPHNMQRGIYGLFLGVFVLFSELSKNLYAQVVVEAAGDHSHAAHAIDATVQSMSTFNMITAVSGFVVCVHSIIRFYVDMYDRFKDPSKPTKKRGSKQMPGDSGNPKLAKIIKATKAIVAPVKKPNGWIALIFFVVALSTFGVVLLCEAAPMTVHIERSIEIIFGLLSLAAWIITFKHTPRSK